jgi:anaerobic selenocysteine-containing dehydrogenase
LAEVVGGRVVGLKGDPEHPLTRGRICVKGKKLLERLYHPQRLREPRMKANGRWKPLSWETAIDILAERFASAIQSHGSQSILYYADSGYGGLVKSVDHLFFNCLGGVSVPRGSLCWAAGIAAQRYDFGDVRSHAFQDLVNARCILIWGRNPVATNPHSVPFLQEARRQGAFLVVIDPLKTLSAAQADLHLQPRPGTDAALALGMAHHLLATDRIDREFLAKHALGFERFRKSLQAFSPATAAAITGLPKDAICQLTACYADRSPASIIVGMGLQRYANGGNTVRCIDALAALTGNIGRPGGGVNYANRSIAPWIDRTGGAGVRLPTYQPRTFALPRMARFLASANDPPIRVAMFAKANPLVQMPGINDLERALARVPFKIVIDMFMTDTARAADLVLPCTSILEEEDLVYSSMFSPYLNYSGRVVAPPDGLIGEYDLYRRLARRMQLIGYPDVPARIFLENALKPLTRKFGVTIEDLQTAPFKIPGEDVPWRDGHFRTPSGRYEFYSTQALTDGGHALPIYEPAKPAPAGYPFRLLTPHPPHAMHSQQFAFRSDPPVASIHPEDAVRHDLVPDRTIRVVSPRGHITARLQTDAGILPGIIKIDQGWWHQSGSVNRLTSDVLSDMGENAAYHEAFCRIDPLGEDQGDR